MQVMTKTLLRIPLRWVAFLVIAVVAIYLLLVNPVHTYFHQREQMHAAQSQNEVLAKANKELNDRVNELQTDQAIQELARERYELVPPGEQAYSVMPAPVPSAASEEKPKPKQSLWNKIVDTVSFWN